jgi:hypothetical protein
MKQQMELNQKLIHSQSQTERRHTLRILQLRTAPQFNELVKMLSRGKSVWSTVDWFQRFENRGEMSGCTFETARLAMTSLNLAVKAQLAKLPPRPEVKEIFTNVITALVKESTVPTVIEEMEKTVVAEVEKMEAAKVLKYGITLQLERIKEMRELEKRLKMIMPMGNNLLRLLKDLADALRKCEMSEFAMKKAGVGLGDPFNAEMTQGERAMLPEVKVVAEMPEAEKNLVRDATAKVIDLIKHVGKRGQYSTRLETDGGGAERA